VKGGRILAVHQGGSPQVQRRRNQKSIDLTGKTMLPASSMHHGHVFMGGIQAALGKYVSSSRW